MPTTVSGSFTIAPKVTIANTVGAVVTRGVLSEKWALTFASGTGTGSADLLYSTTGTATAAPVTIDLSSAATLAPLGGSVAMARVKIVRIRNLSDVDANFLLIDGTAANAWLAPFDGIATAKLKIPAGGIFLLGGVLATALPVVAGTGDLLVLDPGAATIPYAVDVVGCSVDSIAPGSSSGVAAASAVGRSLSIAPGSSSGVAAASAVGRSLSIAAGSSAGVGTASA